jgi:hypothetical protein
VDRFGRSARDTLTVSDTGRLDVVRLFSSAPADIPKGKKHLKFWLHFVPNPVQVGALTSPQAMLAPLEIAWRPAGA